MKLVVSNEDATLKSARSKRIMQTYIRLITAELVRVAAGGGRPERLDGWINDLVIEASKVDLTLNDIAQIVRAGATDDQGGRDVMEWIGQSDLDWIVTYSLRLFAETLSGNAGLASKAECDLCSAIGAYVQRNGRPGVVRPMPSEGHPQRGYALLRKAREIERETGCSFAEAMVRVRSDRGERDHDAG